MGRHPRPRHITLGGREAVALTVREYEQLIASRRQIGGQSARVRVLGEQAKRTEELLRDLESLVAATEDSCPERADTATAAPDASCPGPVATIVEPDGGCLRCAIAALLRRHRGPAA
ncbi:hypothetical protein [Streptomyces sp. LN245]|uniref:hypothetical protein n=1 Tax=Streptomyces sp. LN245 TaxID=3112975 RepID=UPI00371BAEC9